MALTPEETIGVAGGVFAVVVLAFVAYLAFLHWRNLNPAKSITPSSPRWARVLHVFQRFVAHLLIELIGLVFVIVAIIDLETYNAFVESSPPGGWSRDELHNIRIAFYFFQAAKYALLVFTLVVEFRPASRHWPVQLAIKSRGWVRADWPSVLWIAILLPVIMIDGLLINAELFLSNGRDLGDLFEFDSVVLLALDIILFVKLFLGIAQRVHANGAAVDVKAMAWECLQVVHLISMAVVFILFQLDEVAGGMRLSSRLLIVLTSIVLHPIVCGYTSLMAQQITATDRALRTAPQVRVAALLSIVRYFRRIHYIYALNIFLYGYAYFLYIWPFVLTGIDVGEAQARREPALQVGILTALIALNVVSGVLLANLIFASLKRLGPFVGLKAPFDCSSYAHAVNAILAECNASFRCDTHMQTR